MTHDELVLGPGGGAGRSACVQAGMMAGLAGLAVFLVLHHLWIIPIWFIAPVGAVMAAAGGAAVGAAYAELLPHLPPRPWTAVVVALGIVVVLGPSIVIAELLGPVYMIGPSEGGRLLVPVSEAVAGFVAGLLLTAAVSGGTVGWLVGRRRSAAGWTSLAGLALALGPGHNIPLLGATPAVTKEIVILAAVCAVSSVVLVEAEAFFGTTRQVRSSEADDVGVGRLTGERDRVRTAYRLEVGCDSDHPSSGRRSAGSRRQPRGCSGKRPSLTTSAGRTWSTGRSRGMGPES